MITVLPKQKAWPLFLKRVILQTIKAEANCFERCFSKHIMQKTAPAQLSVIASTPRLSYLIHAKAFSTVEDSKDERKKKRNSETTLSNVGRKISERIIRLIDEQGNDMGSMHRADVIKLLDKRDLRLVKRNSNSEPPEYQLMTGIQIHEERLRLREQEKLSPKLEEMFNQVLQAMPGMATFSSRPQAVKGGKATMCVLRPLSKKEEDEWRQTHETQKGDILTKENGNDRESVVLHP